MLLRSGFALSGAMLAKPTTPSSNDENNNDSENEAPRTATLVPAEDAKRAAASKAVKRTKRSMSQKKNSQSKANKRKKVAVAEAKEEEEKEGLPLDHHHENNNGIHTKDVVVKMLDRKSAFNDADMWWMVDLQANPAPRQGATPLVRRCMKACGWDESEARRVLTAYRQFLHIKKMKKDWNAEITSPSVSVDQMWHQHILDVVSYVHDCMLLCGFVVGHNPDGMYDEEGRNLRRTATREALLECFGDAVDRSADGEWKEVFHHEAPQSTAGPNKDITFHIKDQTGKLYRVSSKSGTKMEKIFQSYAEMIRRPLGTLRFLLDGERVNGHDETPLSLELQDNDQIDCVLEQSGC